MSLDSDTTANPLYNLPTLRVLLRRIYYNTHRKRDPHRKKGFSNKKAYRDLLDTMTQTFAIGSYWKPPRPSENDLLMPKDRDKFFFLSMGFCNAEGWCY